MPDKLVDTVSREASDLAAVKAREAAVLAAIQRGDPEIECGSFGMSQLRLRPVVADEWGGLWICDGTKLRSTLVRTGRAIAYDMSADAVARNGDG